MLRIQLQKKRNQISGFVCAESRGLATIRNQRCSHSKKSIETIFAFDKSRNALREVIESFLSVRKFFNLNDFFSDISRASIQKNSKKIFR